MNPYGVYIMQTCWIIYNINLYLILGGCSNIVFTEVKQFLVYDIFIYICVNFKWTRIL